ncbi:hypothetical protein Y1Q_0011283 [Alligator mississippiensis]|uniref:Uncharacterized protein n=1 Tax=Alligator mississippiensis TaxID=8496 RepID=A0A151N8P0_ALLMI|nr:hypothetical protein Y1Q_0011283 [Alligator mississippiensis]
MGTILSLQDYHLWAHRVSQDWWLHIVQHTCNDKQWLDGFFMTQATFWDLLQQLQPHLEWQDAGMCLALPTDTWLALVMLKLAMLISLQCLGHLFSVEENITASIDAFLGM